ncbi:hypercellular protein-like protein HypA [Ampelomyces quisqualis]|uniref:Hypercellular protein-like protein HypA n=1 Tax=Ampelomyces quisqualis TaxID=50730 RepID=A0A6A5QVB6_AMPQU|nr:hypercellular protein-like protein HypA [Ampelomyces quisqualis]
MAVDPLSPVAPARIRALLLPVGRIKRSRFLNYVELLQQQSLVRLGDISPDPRPDRNMFYPLAFPNGTLLYDLSTSLPPASHRSLSPFELFREPLLVIGIGDASEYPWLNSSRESDGAPQSQYEGLEDIQAAVEDIRGQFSRAYLHSLMLFDAETQNSHPRLPPETIFVPPTSRLKTTTMKTILCDLTATLLAEMTTLARSIQALSTVASPAAQHGGGDSAPSWASSDHSTVQFSRRNSQVPNSSISESLLSGTQKDHRMSMPVLPSTSGGPSIVDGPRAASPSRQDNRTPPTTFDEIPGVNAANVVHQANSNATKASTATKDAASDRVSIHGFGSGGVGERARNKGRGRVSIVVGTLYMCAGQWQDAVRELVDGANRARAFSDHLWHAKALENIMVCMLLFAWSGMDFQIPSLCYPTSDKTAGTKSPQHTPSASVADVSANLGSGNEAALERLNALLPDLINMILNLYTRAANFAGESLPPLAFSECVIRFSKMLAAINLSAGYMDEDTLQHLVRNTPYRQKPRMSVPRLSVHPTRNDVASMLFRALPGPVESVGINPTDRVVVLAGIASVLSSLGLQRKKAIIMKDFINSLIPGLVQARKIGAAEMGVHPAAGLAALNMVSGGASSAGALNLGEGEVESGIEEFLGLLGRIYGIPASKETMSQAKAGSRTLSGQETSESVIADILKTSSLRAFGSVGLKLEVLRMCLNFCEALPDFNGVLHFTALLLRMAGPGTAPRPNSTDVFVSLPRDEQVKLFSNISRTVVAANKLGLQHEETEYWDDFLVRGLFILEEPVPLRLIHHRPAELRLTTSRSEGPFLHNPWLKKPQPSAVETVLVANEEYRFVIALQNPYDFELEVDSLRIAAEGEHFVAVEKHFFLGPYRTQKFQIAGVAQSAGTIKIIGCYVKVIGCRERLFPIFPEPWKPMRESKMKRTGLKACLGAPASRPSSAMAPLTHRTPASEPKPDSLTFNIIPDQPIVVVTDVSLPQSSLMVLEGERAQFTVTVKNTSQTTAVDFVHITFQDSATSSIQTATTNKDVSPVELHELEVQLAHHPSLRWCKDTDEETINIKPGAKIDFTIEVVGRTRLMDAVVQIDYANLGKRRSEVNERFFTRQVSVPISITVNASVQLQRPDIVPLSSDFAWTKSTRSNHLHSITHHLDPTKDQEYCMLLLDLRNSWPNPLSISLFLDPPFTSSDPPPPSPPTITEIIQPGHVSRIALILPKLHLPTAHAPIPSLNPATTRQFVVSASKISPEAERLTREAFWYRDALLRRVRGTWAEYGGTAARHGELELRSLRLSARMLDAVRLDDVKISMSVRADDDDDDDKSSVNTARKRQFQVDVDRFYTLKTTIENRSTRAISPLLRLQPHLKDLAHTIALDLDKRFSWTGALQAKLPVLQPGGECVYELGIVALCSGAFEMGATVDEAELLQSEEQGRQRSDTQSLLQRDVIGEPKLRSWVLKEPCVIVARRGER